MKNTKGMHWIRAGVFSAFEYPQHAGLSVDGTLCFLAEYDDIEYLVWDIHAQKVVWKGKGTPLESWVKDGFIEIHEGEAQGKYRIFGLIHNYPLEFCSGLEIKLELDEANDVLNLLSIKDGQTLQQLDYEASTDWAFASFSDNETTIGVLTTHHVTFFTHTT